MKKEIIYSEGDYNIIRHEGIPEAAQDFLDEIAWGTEGAIYQHMNTHEHARLIHNPTLFSINEGEELMGTVVFCKTPVKVRKEEYNCYYVRYFAASEKIKGKGVVKHFSQVVMQMIAEMETGKTIFYASVEADNKASYKVVQNSGYSYSGRVKTMGFSRYFPKKNKAISQITSPEDREDVLALLRTFYADHALVQFNPIFLHNDYYVIREKGKIVAGAQIHKAHWVVNNMKGLMGAIIMNVVPWVPFLNKIFNPKRFQFLAFEGIYFKEGYEKKLIQLFEGLVAQEGLNSGMFWMGESCPYRKKILKLGKLGLLHGFIKDSDVEIMARFKDMSEQEIGLLKNTPIYSSAFDYI